MDDTRPLAAAASIVLAMAVFGFIDNFVIVIAETGGLWQFHLLRSAIALTAIAAISALGLASFRPRRRWAVAGRSFFTSTAMVLYFGSLAFLPISEAAAGLFTSPVWVLLISVFFLGHRVGPVRASAAIAGFCGVLLVLRPDTGAFSPLALVPVLAGLMYALGALATRGWCKGESTLSLVTGMFAGLAVWSLVGLAVLAVLAPEVPAGTDGFVVRGWVSPTPPFIFWTVVQAAGSLLALWFLFRGYQYGEASFVAVFEYSLLIFVSFWAFVLRGEQLDLWGVAGTLLIVASGTTIALRGRNTAQAVA